MIAADDVPAGWEDNWRSFHHGTVIGRFWVGPPWEEAPAGAEAIVIDPGRAFGTGAHPTTRLSLELLQELEPGALLDVGCGSGVLSIAAAKLGFEPVIAIDIDDVAIEVTRANADVNDVAFSATAPTRSPTSFLRPSSRWRTSHSTWSSGCCRGSARGAR